MLKTRLVGIALAAVALPIPWSISALADAAPPAASPVPSLPSQVSPVPPLPGPLAVVPLPHVGIPAPMVPLDVSPAPGPVSVGTPLLPASGSTSGSTSLLSALPAQLDPDQAALAGLVPLPAAAAPAALPLTDEVLRLAR